MIVYIVASLSMVLCTVMMGAATHFSIQAKRNQELRILRLELEHLSSSLEIPPRRRQPSRAERERIEAKNLRLLGTGTEY